MATEISKYDQQRKDKCVKHLAKSKEALAETALYLKANDRDMEEIFKVDDAMEHVNHAPEALGVSVEGGDEN